MANNYQQCSFVIENLTHDEFEWWRLRADNEWWETDREPREFQIHLVDKEVSIFGEEWVDCDSVVVVVREFFHTHRPQANIIINFSYTCSAPRAGEFGGFAVLVTAVAEHWFTPAAMDQEFIDKGVCVPNSSDYSTNIDRLRKATT